MKISGVYKFYQNGELIGEAENSMTEVGRILAVKTIMGAIPNFATSMGIGVSSTANTYNTIPTQIVVSGTFPSQTVVVSVATHSLAIGSKVTFSGITNANITGLNGTYQTITATTGTSLTFTSSASLTNGTFTTGLGTFGNLSSDLTLGLRVATCPVIGTNIDSNSTYDAIMFKGRISDPLQYKIYEVGIFSEPLLSGSTGYKQELAVAFESSDNLYNPAAGVLKYLTDDNYADTNHRIINKNDATYGSFFRIGTKALLLAGTQEIYTENSFTGLDQYDQTDKVILGFYSSTTKTSYVRFYSGGGTSNYITFSFAGVAGYNVISNNISQGAVTGSFDWSNITRVSFYTSGSGYVILDGLKFENINELDTNRGLISRAVLPQEILKVAKIPVDIEYALRIGFGG